MKKLYAVKNFEDDLKFVEGELTLDKMQEIVGGYIESISITDSLIMWVNDEHKINGNDDLNVIFVDGNGNIFDYVTGNVFFTKVDLETGDTISLDGDDIDYLMNCPYGSVEFKGKEYIVMAVNV